MGHRQVAGGGGGCRGRQNPPMYIDQGRMNSTPKIPHARPAEGVAVWEEWSRPGSRWPGGGTPERGGSGRASRSSGAPHVDAHRPTMFLPTLPLSPMRADQPSAAPRGAMPAHWGRGPVLPTGAQACAAIRSAARPAVAKGHRTRSRCPTGHADLKHRGDRWPAKCVGKWSFWRICRPRTAPTTRTPARGMMPSRRQGAQAGGGWWWWTTSWSLKPPYVYRSAKNELHPENPSRSPCRRRRRMGRVV